MRYFPVGLKIAGKKVTVVGGGKVAERKIKSLLDFSAQIKVISPKITHRLLNLFNEEKIIWNKREYSLEDIRGSNLVIAASDNRELNEAVSRDAKNNKIMVNVVDEPGLCDFITAAIIRKHNAVISIFTDAKDPSLSKDLKNFLKEYWNEFLSYRNKL